ncbi:MAG: MopE-related protein [Myxococcota bacterium]|nr:MopE-related protein [Myxococcota bacterium]
MRLLLMGLLGSFAVMGCGTAKQSTESVCDDGIDDDGDGAIDCADSDCDLQTVCDADGDGVSASQDCNDDDPSVYPGATELCDNIDNDCNDIIDDIAADSLEGTIYYEDVDADGYGNEEVSINSCTVPEGYTAIDAEDPLYDCDDSNSDINPNADEICDEIDNNCDGLVDNDASDALTFYVDSDGDGFGADAETIESCTLPEGYSETMDDCDDTSELTYPGADELCDGLDNDCDEEIDTNVVDGTVYYLDGDGDGYGVETDTMSACELPEGYAEVAGDCDDTLTEVYLDAPEICDSLDNDCDTLIDDDDDNLVQASASNWYLDSDSDGYGDDNNYVELCEAPTGYVGEDGDCNDDDITINPGASEVCDGVDQDCDGAIDDKPTDGIEFYYDGDGDGFGSTAVIVGCTLESGYADNADDCNDDDAAVNPAAIETCDGVDSNCSGDESDTTVPNIYYSDADGDGYGDPNSPVQDCTLPSGAVENQLDCDDTSSNAIPDASNPEICDGLDNDCNGDIDEADANLDASTLTTYYTDADGDGFGIADADSVVQCLAPTNFAPNTADCDDTQALVNPDAEEVCDSVDNDCDGGVDNDATDGVAYYLDLDGDGYGDPDSVANYCSVPTNGVSDATDCDDSDGNINTDGIESCTDGADNDCDGSVDCDDSDCSTTSECGETGNCSNGIDDDADGFLDCDDSECADTFGCYEWSCSNGSDDDSDGFVDCLDSDCEDSFLCIESDCTDGLDDENDGAIDCDDSDCASSADCGEVSCSDGIDNDGDGDLDCADSECTYDSACYESDCADSLDNDGDGDADCADSDCALDAACYDLCDGTDSDGDGLVDCDDPDCEFESACYDSCDGTDSDGDGLVDCDDDDCSADFACLEASCPHGDIGGMLGDGVATGDNSTASDLFDPGCHGGSGGKEYTYTWTAPGSGCAVFDTSDSTYDTTLMLYDDCSGSELACNDDGSVGTRSEISYSVEEGVDYIVVVDGYSSSSTGTYQLDIALSEGVGCSGEEQDCSDGDDNDGDGFVDCADSDCGSQVACQESDCSDGTDDDGDGATDCDDSDCEFDAACFDQCDGTDSDGDGLVDCDDPDCSSESTCVDQCDGTDSDGDGLVDCDDPDCVDNILCLENCSDSIDNDGDGDLDCDDSDCSVDFSCLDLTSCPNGDLGEASGDAVAIGNNSAVTDDFNPSCASSGGKDVTYSWTASASGCAVIDTSDSSYDTTLMLYESCNGSELACNDDGSVGTRSEISYSVEAGMEYLIVVDAYSSFSSGDYQLDIALSEGVGCNGEEQDCSDGDDNDGDGFIDCADTDCGSQVACQELDCSDGADNDGDGVTDCDDSDCSTDGACFDQCDGTDSDGDGLVDCDDPDCEFDAACFEYTCDDSADDDGDGLIDCDDPDCDGDLSCQETNCNDGIDDDNDGLADCYDTDCHGDFICESFCETTDLGTSTGAGVASGQNAGLGDYYQPTCSASANGGGEEAIFAWEAPASGTYSFSAVDSDYDTVLYLLEDCIGSELVCNDDEDFSSAIYTSAFEVELLEGDEVTIVIDAYDSSAFGNYSLDIYPEFETDCGDSADNDNDGLVDCDDTDDCAFDAACAAATCPNFDLGDVTGDGLVMGSLASSTQNQFVPSCSSQDSNDLSFAWEAPISGCATVDTLSGNMDSILMVYDGCPSAGGTEIACNDDADAGFGVYESEISFDVTAGDTYVIGVDAWSYATSQTYILDVNVEENVSCP